MQAYEQDLDEEAGYDDYYSDDNGLDEYEEEEEEEEVPPKEELEYLELRQKIKESIRKKSSASGSVGNNAQSSQDRRKKLPYNDFGSFFGPSRPVISSRVIQESKSLLENEIKNSNQPKKRPVPASSSGDRNVSHEKKRPKVVSATRRKVETLKDTRDYSFLFSDDAELPAPKKEPLSRSGSFPNSGFLLIFKRLDLLNHQRDPNNHQLSMAELLKVHLARIRDLRMVILDRLPLAAK